MASRLAVLSYYHLLYELLQDGRSGAFPDLEPIAVDELLAELSARSGNAFGSDRNKWAQWFIATPGTGASEEKKSIATVKKIYDIERKGLDPLEDDQQ